MLLWAFEKVVKNRPVRFVRCSLTDTHFRFSYEQVTPALINEHGVLKSWFYKRCKACLGSIYKRQHLSIEMERLVTKQVA